MEKVRTLVANKIDMEGLRIKDFSFGETILTAILVFGFSAAVWAQNEQTNRTEAKLSFLQIVK